MDAGLRERFDAMPAADAVRVIEVLWDALDRIAAGKVRGAGGVAQGALDSAFGHLELCEEIEHAADPPLH